MAVNEQAERHAFVEAARGWLRTPFHDGACLKGVGVDCAQLVRAAAIEAGLRKVEPTGAYGSQWMLHKNDERLVDFIRLYASEIGEEHAGMGDLVVYRVGRAYAHVAILSGPGTIIHAHKHIGCVTEARMDDLDMKGRERRFFSPWR